MQGNNNCESSFIGKNKIDEIKKEVLKEKDLISLSEIYKALSEPSRLLIIQVLSIMPMCVCDITEVTALSQSLVSHHLRVLRNLGLVKYKKDGKMYIYSIDDDHVASLFKQGLEHSKEKNK